MDDQEPEVEDKEEEDIRPRGDREWRKEGRFGREVNPLWNKAEEEEEERGAGGG